MSAAQKVQQMLARDIVLKTVSADGLFRIVVANTTCLTREALRRTQNIPSQRLHSAELSRQQLTDFSSTLCTANMMASFLNSEERVAVMVGDGDKGQTVFHAESLALGECRGYMEFHEHNEKKFAENDFRSNVFRVTRTLYNASKPMTSTTVRCGDNVAQSASHFFKQSDGIPTAVVLTQGIDRRQHFAVQYAGGLLIQPLAAESLNNPGVQPNEALENQLVKIQDRVQGLCDIADVSEMTRRMLDGRFCGDLLACATGDIDGTAATMKAARQVDFSPILPSHHPLVGPLAPAHVPADERITLSQDAKDVERCPLDFFCRCNKEAFVVAMRSMSEMECRNLRSRNPNMTFTCKYCSKKYTMDNESWEKVFLSLPAVGAN